MQYQPLKIISLSVALICGLTTIGHAADVKPYVNAGLGILDDAGRSDFAPLITGTVRGGIEISRHFAIEAEGQFGLSDKEETYIITQDRRDERRVKIDSQLGIFVVGRAPLSKNFSFHGRAGYGQYSISAKTDQFFQDETPIPINDKFEHQGIILGVGGEYMFGRQKVDGIRFDTSLLIDVDNDDLGDESGLPDVEGIPGFTLAYVRKF